MSSTGRSRDLPPRSPTGSEDASLAPLVAGTPPAGPLEPVSIDVRNEHDDLRTVLVHRPGREIERLTLDNRSEFLFEDVPRLERMQREHDAFVSALEAEGVRALYLEDLLFDILVDQPTRRRLLRAACEWNHQRSLASVLVGAFGDRPNRVRSILMAGLTAAELAVEADLQPETSAREQDVFLLQPLPNRYFTRDPGAAVGRQLVCANMHHDIRMPEPLLLRTILMAHPLFRAVEFAFGADRSSQRPFTIEGGDILVLSDEAIAVGCGERTSTSSIHLLAERLFESEQVARVYEVGLPARASFAHLDAAVTVVDRGRILASPSALDSVHGIVRHEPKRFGGRTSAVPSTESRSFAEILTAEWGGGTLEVIHVAEEGGRAAEAPWSGDAVNVLAIGPSRVVSFGRNIRTNQALREHGVEVIEVEGSELVRGLGGPRAIAMPLHRAGRDAPR
ncbi:hypothetical protein K8I85_08755 [bacterium]|nr:hypothetical protein [bacterium]